MMSLREQQDAELVGLPLPLGQISRTTEGAKKYEEMVEQYGKSPDFARMAQEWNDTIYRAIAAAVKGNAPLKPIFFTDQYKLRAHATELKRRVSSNKQFTKEAASFVAHSAELDASDSLAQGTAHRPIALPAANEHGGRSAESINSAPSPAASSALPQPRAAPRYCKKCKNPMRGHSARQCRQSQAQSRSALQPAPQFQGQCPFRSTPAGCLLGAACIFKHT